MKPMLRATAIGVLAAVILVSLAVTINQVNTLTGPAPVSTQFKPVFAPKAQAASPTLSSYTAPQPAPAASVQQTPVIQQTSVEPQATAPLPDLASQVDDYNTRLAALEAVCLDQQKNFAIVQAGAPEQATVDAREACQADDDTINRTEHVLPEMFRYLSNQPGFHSLYQTTRKSSASTIGGSSFDLYYIDPL